MSRRLVISSLPTMLDVIRRFPEVYKISAFAAVKPYVDQVAKVKPSGCATCRGANPMTKYTKAFENALLSLSSNDMEFLKKLLSVEQVCYYIRNSQTNKLELKCQ